MTNTERSIIGQANDSLNVRENGWRASADIWLEAAYQMLIDKGIDAVRILPLAEKLQISRTSFYWFFRDRDMLLNALLRKWQEQNTPALHRQAAAPARNLAEATLNIIDCWLDNSLFDNHLEHAIRGWALQSTAVNDAIKQADIERLAIIQQMFIRFGTEPMIAEVKSRALYLTHLGYISTKMDIDIPTRLRLVPAYVALFTGALPDEISLNILQRKYRV
jgi:AcrR family transcriptional regulator